MASAKQNVVELPPIVDLDAVESLRDQLQEAIEHGPVCLSGAGVERISTNALFMILSSAETARQHQTGFSVSAPAEPMMAAIARLGLGSEFAGLLKG